MILAIKLVFFALVLAAAIQDMRELRISNWISIALIALFPLWILATRFEADIWQNVVLCLVMFGVGILLFSMRWLGGGDVKLLAAISLWFNFPAAPALILAIALGGAVLVLALAVIRRALPEAFYIRTSWKVFSPRGPIPYGVAIAAGAMLSSSYPGFNPHPQSTLDVIMSVRLPKLK